MKLEIIIPVTRPQRLSHCLKQFIQQTYDHHQFEIILVMADDCIIDLPPTDVKITRLIENNLHPSMRRNRGVRHTQTELVAFLDDDIIVSRNWVEQAIKSLHDHPWDGVCGPLSHFDEKASLPYQLAGAANDSFFLEGFEDTHAENVKKVNFYNMPLCNCLIKRSVWEAVGGFNETSSYYIDDIEFFYIASHLGYSFFVIPEIKVHHMIEPFPVGYLKKKMITRFNTGINTILFNEIYGKMPFIKLAIAVFGILTGIGLLFPHHVYATLCIAGISYLSLAIGFSWKYLKKHPMVFGMLPLTFLTTHIIIFLSFIGGISFSLFNRNKYQPILISKWRRFMNAKISPL